jgi:hypothetical protein
MAISKIPGAGVSADTLEAGDIAAGAIGTSELAADAVTGAELADNAVNSEHYTDVSIDTAHLGNLQVTAAKVASDVATTAGSQTFTNKTLTAPTLTTPALGTPASGVVTNLTGVLPVGVTGGSGLTALGTVTSGIIMTATNPRLTITKQAWSGDTTGTTETVVDTYYNWQNTKASSTVFIEMTFPVQISVTGGSSSLRYARWVMYYSTSPVSNGVQSGFGTLLDSVYAGRTTATTTSNGNASFATLTTTGTFTTSGSVSTNYYFGLTSDADGTYTRHETWAGTRGTLIKILEY